MKFALLIFVFPFFLISCGGGASSSSGTSVACTSSPAPVYTNQVDSLLNNNCVGCHSNFSSYSGAAASASQIATQVSSGAMPKNGTLNQSTKDLIVQWAACGAAH